MSSACKIMFDGGSRGNPGLCGSGFVIYPHSMDNNDASPIPIFSGCAVVSQNETNNFAEYMGVILAMKKAKELGYTHVHIYGDSKLVIYHLKKEWKCCDKLQPLLKDALNLLKNFDEYSLHHIRRKENKEADKLANHAMDYYQNLK